MLKNVKNLYLLFFPLCLAMQIQAAELTESLTIEAWSVPRHGEVVRNLPVLRKVMQAMQSSPAARLLIRYPGGDEGTLWAHELRGWLISLGLGSDRMELMPGSPNGQSLSLIVTGLPDDQDVGNVARHQTQIEIPVSGGKQ